MKKMFAGILSLFIAFGSFSFVGCGEGEDEGGGGGGGGGGSFAGSCTLSAMSLCLNYIGSIYTPESTEEGCDGTYSVSACPANGALGVCAHSSGAVSEYQAVFYPPDYGSAEQAEADCSNSNGTWSSAYTPPS